MTALVWVDGDLVPAPQARISALDTGFRSGLGVFETLRVDGGRAFRLAAHLDRLQAGARTLGVELDRDRLRSGVAATVAANDALGSHLAVRITCSAGAIEADSRFPGRIATPPTAVITAQPTDAPSPSPATATAMRTDLRREVAGCKHTSYLVAVLAQQRAAAAGCSDGLLTDAAGAPLEAATANLFVVQGATLLTPPPAAGILPGITRAAVLELGPRLGLEVVERTCTLTEVHHADEVLLTSAVRGVRAVVTIDGHPIGAVGTATRGGIGPVARTLAAGYRALVDREASRLDLS